MMRKINHPLVESDLDSIAEHILVSTSGNQPAVERRLDEVDDLIARIAANPQSGRRLGGQFHGWLVRHGGRGHRITVAFRPAPEAVYIALVTFGGQDWMGRLTLRRDFGA